MISQKIHIQQSICSNPKDYTKNAPAAIRKEASVSYRSDNVEQSKLSVEIEKRICEDPLLYTINHLLYADS